jgi:hypothetical protein
MKRYVSINTVQDATMFRASQNVLIKESQISRDDAELKEHEIHFELKMGMRIRIWRWRTERQRNTNNIHIRKSVGCKEKRKGNAT